MTTSSMLEARRADSARRRQRVSTAISEAAASCGELSVAAVARRAGVDRTFLYRHRDLLTQLHAAAIEPAACPAARSRQPRCRQTSQPPRTARRARPRGSGNWNASSPSFSASRPGRSQAWAHRMTSSSCSGESPSLSSRWST